MKAKMNAEPQYYRKICDYVRNIKSGREDLVPEFWCLILPSTTAFAREYLFVKSKGTRLFDADDIVNQSYFALFKAINSFCISDKELFYPDDIDKEARRFLYLYKLCIRAETARIRCVFRRHDPFFYSTSINSPVDGKNGDEGSEFGEFIRDPCGSIGFEEVARAEYLVQLKYAIATLSKYLSNEEMQVIHEIYYENLTLDQVSQKLNISKGVVWSLQKRALSKYRTHQSEVKLRSFLLEEG